MTRRPWSALSAPQKVALIVVGTAEIVLSGVALRDLARRERDDVRGPKPLWALVSLVQPIGPPAYLLFGRRSRT